MRVSWSVYELFSQPSLYSAGIDFMEFILLEYLFHFIYLFFVFIFFFSGGMGGGVRFGGGLFVCLFFVLFCFFWGGVVLLGVFFVLFLLFLQIFVKKQNLLLKL